MLARPIDSPLASAVMADSVAPCRASMVRSRDSISRPCSSASSSISRLLSLKYLFMKTMLIGTAPKISSASDGPIISAKAWTTLGSTAPSYARQRRTLQWAPARAPGSTVELWITSVDVGQAYARYAGWALMSDGTVSADGKTATTATGFTDLDNFAVRLK